MSWTNSISGATEYIKPHGDTMLYSISFSDRFGLPDKVVKRAAGGAHDEMEHVRNG